MSDRFRLELHWKTKEGKKENGKTILPIHIDITVRNTYMVIDIKSHQEGVLMPTIGDRMRYENPNLESFCLALKSFIFLPKIFLS